MEKMAPYLTLGDFGFVLRVNAGPVKLVRLHNP